MLPFSSAKKLPIFFYGKVKFSKLKNAKIIINAPLIRGMVGFGQPYEMNKAYSGLSEINISGTIIFNGYCQFGKDYFLYVSKDAICEFGNMSSIASRGKIICSKSIELGDYARLGSECQIIDTNFHDMIDTKYGKLYSKYNPIKIGSYNFISNRVSIMKGSITPDYCTIASNTLCNKDFSNLGNNVLIGGVPAKLLKDNISRDWKGEENKLLKSLQLDKKFNLTVLVY